jgi:hypothetical protein
MTMLALLAAVLAFLAADDPALLTTAERSEYRATSRYEEVVDLLRRIDERSAQVHLTEMGTSVEGRPIPLAVVARPPVTSAEEAKASGKLIVFAFGNIHAGEVCGKEALCMLARERALEPDHPWFDDILLLLAPIYNTDGNERISPDNRPGQVGPELGMGQRPNAQGLDLNRDHVKLESPEAQAHVRLLETWDPHVIIDTHTTNGSRHRYTLTYSAPLNPAAHPAPVAYLRDELLPRASERLEERTGYATFFYGNFNRDHTAWATYSAQPRFGGPYRGLRNRMSILTEAYAYAPYRDRVLCTLEFVREAISIAAEDRERIVEILDRARRETIEAGAAPQPDATVGIRHRIAAFPTPVVIPGYVLEPDERGRLRPTGEPADHRVIHLGRFEPARSVSRPYAYVLEPGLGAIVEKLEQHGIVVESFEGEATVESYRVVEHTTSRREFQGHREVRLECEAGVARRAFPEGSSIVRTAQPLGTLAVYLLEPESDDGLATWNFFDPWIAEGGQFPVHRIRHPADL